MRLASGDISEAELAAYRRWAADPVHEATFQHELALWRSLGAIGDRLAPAAPLPAMKAAGRRRIRIRAGYAGAAIAACLAIMVAGPELVLRAQADHRTGVAVQSLTLPDGTRAVLDASSAIAVRYDGDQRLVELLRGRAWFDVAHGDRKPFRVAAIGGLVEDIGTAFVVGEENGNAEAAVTDGVIRVRSRKGAPWMTLRAGQRASWVEGGAPARVADIPASRVAAWREGDILLDDVAVRAAIREIARYRAGPTFVTGAVDGLPPVTAIVRAQRPDEGLEALAASARLEIINLPGGITIVRPAG